MILLTGLTNAQVSLLSTDFSSSPASMTLHGSASHADGEVELVPASTSQQGSVIFSSPAGNKLVQVFDVNCEVYTGNAANASLPADGWCFAWGNVSGSFSEEGPTNFTGLVVSFDYFINAPEPGREVTVRWNGVQVASVLYNAYTAGAITPVQIRVRNGGLLDVVHNGNQLFSGLALPSFTGLADPKFAFGARTGGQTAKVAFDRLSISALGLADQTILEDSEPLEIAMSTALTSQPSAVSSNTALLSQDGISITGSGTERTLRLTPQANAHGTAEVTVTDSVTGYTSAFSLSVTPVNDAPSFAKGHDVHYSAGNAGLQTFAYWASNISAGPADEASQTLTFEIENTQPSLFSHQPEITPDGTLSFTPAPQESGTATLTVRLKDNGGTAHNGIDTSPYETFTITIGEDLPNFNASFESGLPSGAWAFGNAKREASEMQLVSSAGGKMGAYVVQNITGSEIVTNFDVSCDVFTGNAQNPALPADGWCFAVGDVPFAAFGEDGPSGLSGLVISFDYYVNGGPGDTARDVAVIWNGVQIASVAYDAYVHNSRVPLHVRMRHGGLLDVWHNGNELFHGLAVPGYAGLVAPRWGFGARTGGLTAEVSLSNLSINPQPYLVTNVSDSGAGSLRAALSHASSSTGANQIHFDSALNGQIITLNTEELYVGGQTLAIDASMLSSGITISGNQLVRIFNGNGSSTNVLFHRLHLTQGKAHQAVSSFFGGGGLVCSGSAEMVDCSISHCVSDTIGGGVTIHSGGKLTLTRCTLNNNQADIGGGIASRDQAELTLTRCTVYGNTAMEDDGGGISLENGTARISHCTISGNTSDETAGGLRQQEGATLMLENSIIAGNTAPNYPDAHFDSINLTTQGVNVIGAEDDTAPVVLRAGLPNAAGHFIGTASAPLDVGLQSFGNHGGLTSTLLLESQSIARNACPGSSATTDQRGFPLVGIADAGAAEAQIDRIDNVTMPEDSASSVSVYVGQVGTLELNSDQPTIVDSSRLFAKNNCRNAKIKIVQAFELL